MVAVLEALPAEELAEEVVEYTFRGVPPSPVRRAHLGESLVGWTNREVIANPDKTWTVRWTFRPSSDEEMAAYLRRKRGQDAQVMITRLRAGRVVDSADVRKARKRAVLKHYDHRLELETLAQTPGDELHWHGVVVHHTHPDHYHEVSEGRDGLVLAHRGLDAAGRRGGGLHLVLDGQRGVPEGGAGESSHG